MAETTARPIDILLQSGSKKVPGIRTPGHDAARLAGNPPPPSATPTETVPDVVNVQPATPSIQIVDQVAPAPVAPSIKLPPAPAPLSITDPAGKIPKPPPLPPPTPRPKPPPPPKPPHKETFEELLFHDYPDILNAVERGIPLPPPKAAQSTATPVPKPATVPPLVPSPATPPAPITASVAAVAPVATVPPATTAPKAPVVPKKPVAIPQRPTTPEKSISAAPPSIPGTLAHEVGGYLDEFYDNALKEDGSILGTPVPPLVPIDATPTGSQKEVVTVFTSPIPQKPVPTPPVVSAPVPPTPSPQEVLAHDPTPDELLASFETDVSGLSQKRHGLERLLSELVRRRESMTLVPSAIKDPVQGEALLLDLAGSQKAIGELTKETELLAKRIGTFGNPSAKLAIERLLGETAKESQALNALSVVAKGEWTKVERLLHPTHSTPAT